MCLRLHVTSAVFYLAYAPDNYLAKYCNCPAPPKANVDKSLAPYSKPARDESTQVNDP